MRVNVCCKAALPTISLICRQVVDMVRSVCFKRLQASFGDELRDAVAEIGLHIMSDATGHVSVL